jgi:hypothetical protein
VQHADKHVEHGFELCECLHTSLYEMHFVLPKKWAPMSFIISKKRWLVAGIAAATLAGGAYAFANSLTVTTDNLGAGSATVNGPNCQARVSYAVEGVNPASGANEVSSVTVTPLPLPGSAAPGCANDKATVILTGSGGAPFPYLAYDPTVSQSFGSPPAAVTWIVPAGDNVLASNVTDVHVAITGP